MDVEMTISAYLTIAGVFYSAFLVKLLIESPPPKDTWTKIKGLEESLQELTRVYAKRKEVMYWGMLTGMLTCLFTELALMYLQIWSDWAPVIDTVVASLHIRGQ